VTPDAYAASERKLAAAHRALLHTRGLQLDFASAPKPPQAPEWLKALIDALVQLAPVLKLIFWGGLILGAILIVVFVAREVAATRWRKPQAAQPTDWRPEPEQARALLEDADRLAAAGLFGEAIHLLLFRSIDDLAGRRPGLIRPALTSRDIAGLEPIPPAARNAFARIAQQVERSFFGGRSASADDFSRVRGDYETFAFPESWA
jgi:hypothetical protein